METVLDKVKGILPKPIKEICLQIFLKTKYHNLKTRDHSKLMIIGCGRSGTTYISRYFKAAGINIGHEALEEHGIVSWYLTSRQPHVAWSKNFYMISPYNMPIVHQVREPLATISSLQTFNEDSWTTIAGQIPINMHKDSTRLLAMKYWYYWNLKAQKFAQMTYRVEDIKNALPEILKIGKFNKQRNDFPGVPTNLNSRKHDRQYTKLTWQDLEKEDKHLTKDIIELAKSYGYVV